MASRTTWGLMAVVVALPLSAPRALHVCDTADRQTTHMVGVGSASILAGLQAVRFRTIWGLIAMVVVVPLSAPRALRMIDRKYARSWV
jgi:ABC-type phosphate transport system permease subunit